MVTSSEETCVIFNDMSVSYCQCNLSPLIINYIDLIRNLIIICCSSSKSVDISLLEIYNFTGTVEILKPCCSNPPINLKFKIDGLQCVETATSWISIVISTILAVLCTFILLLMIIYYFKRKKDNQLENLTTSIYTMNRLYSVNEEDNDIYSEIASTSV